MALPPSRKRRATPMEDPRVEKKAKTAAQRYWNGRPFPTSDLVCLTGSSIGIEKRLGGIGIGNEEWRNDKGATVGPELTFYPQGNSRLFRFRAHDDDNVVDIQCAYTITGRLFCVYSPRHGVTFGGYNPRTRFTWFGNDVKYLEFMLYMRQIRKYLGVAFASADGLKWLVLDYAYCVERFRLVWDNNAKRFTQSRVN